MSDVESACEDSTPPRRTRYSGTVRPTLAITRYHYMHTHLSLLSNERFNQDLSASLVLYVPSLVMNTCTSYVGY